LIEGQGASCFDAEVVQHVGKAARRIPALAVLGRDALQAQDLLVRFEQAVALDGFEQAVALDVPAEGAAAWLWHPDAMPPWEDATRLSPRQPAADVSFIAMIQEVASERTGGGCSCTERHMLPDGRVIEHGFPMATGWRWLMRRAQYREAFGQELPGWTSVLHPATRGSLVQLALSLRRALPDATPLDELVPPTRGPDGQLL
jgi:hypothetical protein